MKKLPLFLILLCLLVSSCARTKFGILKFEVSTDDSKNADSQPEAGAYFWSGVFKSNDFAAFVAATNTPADTTVIKRVSLDADNRGIAQLSAVGLHRDEADRIAKIIAKTINEYSRAQERVKWDEIRTRLRARIAENPLDRRRLEEQLHEADISAGLIKSDVTRVVYLQ